MKICRVTQAIYPYVVGGSPTHCHELSNNQTNDHSQVTVFTVRRDTKVDAPPVSYKLRQCWWMHMPWDFFGMENPVAPGLGLRVLREDYDVLHAHSHLFFTSTLAIIANKIKGKPSVITVHGVRAVRQSSVNFFQEAWIRLLSRYLFRLVDKVICLTQVDADEIAQYGVPPEKISVIPNGIDTTLFHPRDNHDGYMLWVGRFVSEKGLIYLVDAMEQVAKEYPDTHMVLVGDGPLKDDITTRIQIKGLEQNFDLREKCPQSEIAELMGSCEVFILPSIQEGFPKSLLEAMASGRPVITTSSLAGIVGEAGLVVTPQSVDELSQAMLTYLSDPAKREAAGTKGRSYVEANWSWDVVTEQINNIYQTITQGE
jgi:glycosyltransferase involved in cell wall biosynthesis